MCHATSVDRKAGSVSTNNSQFVDTLSTNKSYHLFICRINEQSVKFLQSHEIKMHARSSLLLTIAFFLQLRMTGRGSPDDWASWSFGQEQRLMWSGMVLA